MTRIWLVNWHFQSRITLWCRHKSTNVSMGLCWQMFIVWRLWSIYFDHHLSLKPFIGKWRKQSCTPNIIQNKLKYADIFLCIFLFMSRTHSDLLYNVSIYVYEMRLNCRYKCFEFFDWSFSKILSSDWPIKCFKVFVAVIQSYP